MSRLKNSTQAQLINAIVVTSLKAGYSPQEIANQLNNRGYKTRYKNDWTAKRVLQRIANHSLMDQLSFVKNEIKKESGPVVSEAERTAILEKISPSVQKNPTETVHFHPTGTWLKTRKAGTLLRVDSLLDGTKILVDQGSREVCIL